MAKRTEFNFYGENYTLVVLRVDERDEFMRPSKVTMMHPGDSVDLRDGGSSSFVTAFVPKKSVKPRARKS